MARFTTSILLLLGLLITSSQASEVISRYFSFVGFEYKGPLGYAFSGPGDDPSLIRLFRMFNWQIREDLYTTDLEERQRLLLDSANGWEDEPGTDNPAWKGMWVYGDAGPAKNRVPLYRLKEKTTHEHLWTVDATEAKNLMAHGWESEGISCYFPNPAGQPTGTAEMLHRYSWDPATT